MSRRRIGISAAVLLAVLALAAGAGWVVWGEDLHYRHSLVRYVDDDQGEKNRFVNLGDGKAQLSIASPDGHRIVVQWRDPDGHGWTAPDTVWTEEKLIAFENHVHRSGGTVTIEQFFTPDVHRDNDVGDVTVRIVCRKRDCDASKQ